MGAPCKLRFSKLGKGTQQTSVLHKLPYITERGVIAKRGSANTPKRWKLPKPHNVRRSNHGTIFVRHTDPGAALRNGGAVGAGDRSQRIPGEIGGKRQFAGSESLRRNDWTSCLVVEPRAHIFT